MTDITVVRSAKLYCRIDDKVIGYKFGTQTEYRLPGGKLNDKESIVDALVREVKEEIGFDLDKEKLVYLTFFIDITFSPEEKKDTIHVTYAYTTSQKIQLTDFILTEESASVKTFKTNEIGKFTPIAMGHIDSIIKLSMGSTFDRTKSYQKRGGKLVK